MTDDRRIRGARDASRINVNESYELRYWTKTLNVSEDTLKQAVQAAGTSTDAVRKYLRR